MSQINRIPRGYLDLVGTETGGRNPNQGVESVSPIITMNELYGAQTLRSQNFATNSLAVGNNNFIEVPAGESWVLYTAGMDVIQPLLGDIDDVGLFVRSLPRATSAAATAQIANYHLEAVAAGDHPVQSFRFPTPLVLTSGVEIIAEIASRAGGAPNRVVNISMLTGVLTG